MIRRRVHVVLAVAIFSGPVTAIHAQGVATGAIRGTLRTEAGTDVDGAEVRVLNTETGVPAGARSFRGRFVVQGLEIGGPYIVEVRNIGFVPLRSEPFNLKLGEPFELRLTMRRMATGLDTIIVAVRGRETAARGATLISDSLVQRLPTPNRNFYDFVVLAPQISTRVGFGRSGVSAAGANLRFNSFLINGADERSVNGSVSAASNAGKSVPLDAVREYAVLVAPYDVRFGDFAGALVNTVTQAGTNELRGSTFGYLRNDWLARRTELSTSEPHERLQYGFSLGGPIVRDRAHFFVAAEAQRLSSPAPGPYAGQPAQRQPPLPVSEADIARLDTIMRTYGLAAGSGGPVEVATPLRNAFFRVDASIPRWRSRLVGFVSDTRRLEDQFSRAAPDTFSLSSFRFTSKVASRLSSLQLRSDLARRGGGHNELFVSHLADATDMLPEIRQPLVRVRVPGVNGGTVTINAGAAEAAHGRTVRSRSIKLRDELSVPVGARHVIVAGAQAEHFSVRRGGVIGGYGTWTFGSLEDLARGAPERYELRKDFGSASRPLEGTHYVAYLGDEWRVRDNVTITTGLRADRFGIDGSAPYNDAVDSVFQRRTDVMPRARIHISPRVGFTWDLSRAGSDKVRGGLGVFTGRPPLAWFVPGLANHGEGIGVLRCGFIPGDAGPPPAFEPDYTAAPTRCATGGDLSSRPFGEVNLLASNLRMAQSLRGSLAYERRLPGNVVATGEVMLSRYLSDFRWVNLNLAGPQGVDRFGRTLYGSLGANGVPQPVLRSNFAEVIELRNTGMNRSYQMSTRLERQFARGIAATASYTYSRTRDVQSPSRVNLAGITMWADARAVSGRHDELQREISLNDLPHRVVAAFTYTAPWQRWSTGISFYYLGESGSPFTYLATGLGRRGDLNADGSNANDPIYVPRSASDTSEIRFSGFSDAAGADNTPAAQAGRVLAQQAGFEQFIAKTPCLSRQRARLLERNSCREPFAHTTVASVRQTIMVGGTAFETELDIYNVLNLLNDEWGRQRIASPRLLEHVGQTSGAAATSQPVFRFDAARERWTTLQAESTFQIQVAARYRF